MLGQTRGALYVVATPIGNLQDFTPRAQETLRNVSLIAAEDTRHSRRLLDHFGIQTHLQALHEHNEKQTIQQLMQRLQGGQSIALISDAGTPLISDPGCHLVAAAHEIDIPVIPIAGASALICALSVAGLTADKFVFEGFLPAKSTTRRQHLHSLTEETRTLVFYEAPHRALDSISDMAEILGGERQVVMARELTKLFETIKRLPLAALQQWLIEHPEQQQGEFVLVVAGAAMRDKREITPEALKLFSLLQPHLPLKQAAKITAEFTGVSRNVLYSLGLQQADAAQQEEQEQ